MANLKHRVALLEINQICKLGYLFIIVVDDVLNAKQHQQIEEANSINRVVIKLNSTDLEL